MRELLAAKRPRVADLSVVSAFMGALQHASLPSHVRGFGCVASGTRAAARAHTHKVPRTDTGPVSVARTSTHVLTHVYRYVPLPTDGRRLSQRKILLDTALQQLLHTHAGHYCHPRARSYRHAVSRALRIRPLASSAPPAAQWTFATPAAAELLRTQPRAHAWPPDRSPIHRRPLQLLL